MSNLIDDIKYNVKNWWWFLVSGLFFIAAGIAIYAWPAHAYASLSILFSLMMVISGFSQVSFAASNSNILKGWGWVLVSGIVDLALGTYLLIYPAVTMVTLPYFLGFWLIIRSFYIMGASFDLQSYNVKGWGWLLFGGIVLLVLGCLIIYYPAAGAISIIAFSGTAFIVGGFLNIYLAFKLKSVKTEVGRVKQTVGKIKEEYKRA